MPALCSLRQSGVQLGLSGSSAPQKGTGGVGERGGRERREGKREEREGNGKRGRGREGGKERERTDGRRKLQFTFASCTHYL